MLSDLTPEEFAYFSAALAYAQALGLEKPPGQMSYRALAEWYETTPADIAASEAAILEKLRNLLHV